MANLKDIRVKGNDNLNLHDKYLYVMRKDGHYDLLYQKNHISFEIQHLKDCDPIFNKFFGIVSKSPK